MNSEFLMPQKYEGNNCGITVAVLGLDNNNQYDDIFIYIEGREQNKYRVDVDTNNNFKTVNVTFDGLENNIFYNIKAEIKIDNEIIMIESRMVPSLVTNKPGIISTSTHNGGALSKGKPTIKEVI